MRRLNFCESVGLPNSSVVIVSDHMFYWQMGITGGVQFRFWGGNSLAWRLCRRWQGLLAVFWRDAGRAPSLVLAGGLLGRVYRAGTRPDPTGPSGGCSQRAGDALGLAQGLPLRDSWGGCDDCAGGAQGLAQGLPLQDRWGGCSQRAGGAQGQAQGLTLR